MERLAEALESSVRSVTQRLGNPVLSLTGGLDSRIIFATALNAGISFEVFTTGETNSPDVIIAKEIAERFGVKHHQMNPSVDEPLTDWARLRTSLLLCDGEYDALEYSRILSIHERLSGQFDLSINGSGGEFCKGYWWELLWPHIGKTRPLDIANVIDKRFLFNDSLTELLAPGLSGPRDSLIEAAKNANQGLSQYPNTLQMDNIYLALRMHRWQGRLASATGQIWPTISPFMLKEPMEIAFSTPPRERIRNRMSRNLNEFANPALARMRTDQSGPALPLRPGTAPLFLGLASAFAGKVAGKVWSKIPFRPGGQKGKASPAMAPGISSYEGLSQFSDVGNWQTLEFFDRQKLAGFVSDYFDNDRPVDKPLGRLITLESVARQLTGDLPE